LEAAIGLFEEAGLSVEAVRCLHMLSIALVPLGKTTLALEAAERSVALSRHAGDRRQEATGLRRMAIVHLEDDRHAEALPYAERALILHREVGDRGEEGNDLNVLGPLKANLGEYAESERTLRLSIEIAESIASPFSLNYAIRTLCLLHYFRRGEYQACLPLVEGWMDKAKTWKDEWLLGSLLWFKGLVMHSLGQYLPARSILELSLRYADSAGSRTEEGNGRQRLATAHARLGDYAQARQNLRIAATLARETGERNLLGATRVEGALITLLEGESQSMRAALETVEKGLAALSKVARWDRTRGYEIGARLHLVLGEIAEAEAYSRCAIDLTEAHPAPQQPQRAFFTHSRILRVLGRDVEADEYLQRAYERVMLVSGKTLDPGLRKGWLENVEVNREILAACAERGIGHV
jgi:tetratricopeptide (TPR) repeat protein